jgi:hypothetical protein
MLVWMLGCGGRRSHFRFGNASHDRIPDRFQFGFDLPIYLCVTMCRVVEFGSEDRVSV